MQIVKRYDYELPFGFNAIPGRPITDFLTDVVESLAAVDDNFKDDCEGNAKLKKALGCVRKGRYEFEEITPGGSIKCVVSLSNAERALELYESLTRRKAEELISGKRRHRKY